MTQRSGDRIVSVIVVVGAMLSMLSPFTSAALRKMDDASPYLSFSTDYQKTLEDGIETLVLAGVAVWKMRQIRREDDANGGGGTSTDPFEQVVP